MGPFSLWSMTKDWQYVSSPLFCRSKLQKQIAQHNSGYREAYPWGIAQQTLGVSHSMPSGYRAALPPALRFFKGRGENPGIINTKAFSYGYPEYFTSLSYAMRRTSAIPYDTGFTLNYTIYFCKRCQLKEIILICQLLNHPQFIPWGIFSPML
jgi:hypothetical protein